MCLLLGRLEPIIAEEDIVCYKIVEKSDKGPLISISQRFEYILGKTYDNGIPDPEKIPYRKTLCGIGLYGGLFHSYSSLKKRQLDKDLKEVEVKCIIPKGAYYFDGYVSGSLAEGYASSQIKIVEIIR